MTRPTIAKILEEGGMLYERVGTHRRLLLADVLAYRERRRAAQHAALESSAIDLDDESDLDSVFAKARRETARRRRESSAS